MTKILARGAEAVIIKKGNFVKKHRVPKGYRYPELDKKLRTLRTRAEFKLLQRAEAIMPVPKALKLDEQNKVIELEYIPGKKLADHLNKLKSKKAIAKQIGKSLAKLHENNIIHGDLTTSNLIYNEKTKKVYFIDFGLGFHSSKVEDKAVDLHVLKEALEARHPSIWQDTLKTILQAYRQSKNSQAVIKQLEKVEKRGRYKAQY